MNILVRVSYLNSFQDRKDLDKRCYNLEDGICQNCKKLFSISVKFLSQKNLEKGCILEIWMQLCTFHFITSVRTQQPGATSFTI